MSKDKKKALSNEEGMIRNNERVIRVLKRGYYPGTAASEIQPAINYLISLNNSIRMSMNGKTQVAQPETAVAVEAPVETAQVSDAPKAD